MAAVKTFWTVIVRRFLNLSRTMSKLSLARLLQLEVARPAAAVAPDAASIVAKIPLDDTHLEEKKCYASIFFYSWEIVFYKRRIL